MQANDSISFSEVQRLSQIALEAGNLDKLQTLLVPLLREDDRSRSANENLFIYRTLGVMYEEKDKPEEALLAFEQAYNYDKRDFKTLETRVEAELKKNPSDIRTGLLLEFLIFHRDTLKPAMVTRLFKALAEVRRANGELDKAREYYEKALEARPGDMDTINAILAISVESGNDDAIIKSREKLLDTMTTPESRAAILVSIGDDYLNAKKDEQTALETYEEALVECSTSTAALQRILTISEHKEDWERALSAIDALVRASDDNDEKVRYIAARAVIFKDKLNDPKRTIDAYNDILDLKPDQAAVFQSLLSILLAQKDYLAIEANYERMIERQRNIDPVNTKFLAILCKSLGDLRLKQLNNIPGAAAAYQIASDLFPDNPKFHAILAKLYAQNQDTLEKAIHENREVLRLAPDHLEVVAQMAECYRKLNKYDEALCIYRVLAALNIINEEGKNIVENYQPDEVPSIPRLLTEDEWKLIRPNTLDNSLCHILRIITPALYGLFTNELDTYGIKKDSRIDTDAPTVFNRTLKNAKIALNFGEIPHVYRWSKASGISNAYLDDRSFLVNENLLSGRTEQEIAFATTKALFLMRPDFYLLERGRDVIKFCLFTAFKVACPQLNIELSKDMQKIAKELENNLNSEQISQLASCVKRISEKNQKLNINLFFESIEDFANRLGLIFCDDPRIIEASLKEEARPISERGTQERLGSLLVWALSEEYLKLRKSLGITIKIA